MAATAGCALPRFSKTKIVATLGPASSTPTMIEALLVAGVDVFRLNMAHGTREQQAVRLSMIRDVSRTMGQPVGVLADLAGPKIRLGELPGGQHVCHAGGTVRFVRGETPRGPDEFTTTYVPLVDELAEGDRVILADGLVSLVVEQRTADDVTCRIVQAGTVRSRQGVNLPGVKLSVPAMSDLDRDNARWAGQVGIDFLGLSFVRRPDEILELKRLLADQQAHTQVIAKIEKPEALDRLTDIISAADGAMVARGDLGVETDIARLALAQKQIVAECHRQCKPVIIATQMLDSMQHSSIPTRAEVSDVANAILDGADACMLSGETAVGEYPREAVEMMHRIALATETMPRNAVADGARPGGVSDITDAAVHAAGHMAEELNAQLVVVASTSGATALALSRHHYRVPTLGVSNSEPTLRRMCLYWGVIPLPGAPVGDPRELAMYIESWGQRNACLKPGDRFVMIAGTGLSQSAHNLIVALEVAP